MNGRPFSQDDLDQLAYLAALPDDRIDLSDIPEMTDEQWARARRGASRRPLKQAVTIELDADVLAWFKAQAQGRDYGTEINRVLRKYVVEVSQATVG